MKKETKSHGSDISKAHANPRLTLRRETVRILTRYELVLVAGAVTPVTEKTEETIVVSPC
jgi:hypothetical protein